MPTAVTAALTGGRFTRGALALALGASLLLASLVSPSAVLAHEHRHVGDYELTVGFLNEPAYEGLLNGVHFAVIELEDEEPVEGLEESVQVEVTHNDSGETISLPLSASFGEPGVYAADFVPTAPGDYTFHFTGTIGETSIDETFNSAEGGFSSVLPIADVQFPEQPASARELEGAVRGASDAADAAADDASGASTMATIGIVLGALGLAAGGGALALTLRRR